MVGDHMGIPGAVVFFSFSLAPSLCHLKRLGSYPFCKGRRGGKRRSRGWREGILHWRMGSENMSGGRTSVAFLRAGLNRDVLSSTIFHVSRPLANSLVLAVAFMFPSVLAFCCGSIFFFFFFGHWIVAKLRSNGISLKEVFNEKKTYALLIYYKKGRKILHCCSHIHFSLVRGIKCSCAKSWSLLRFVLGISSGHELPF